MHKLWIGLLLLSTNVLAKQTELKTTITDVTVFYNGAQVKRVGGLTLQAGEHEIVIRDATSLLKKESIQVKGEGNFTVLSVNHQVSLTDQNIDKKKLTELETKQKELMRQMEEVSVKIEVLRVEETVINNLQNVSTTTEGITVDQVTKAQELMRVKLAAIKNDKLVVSRQMQELYDKHQEVTQQLNALRLPKQEVAYEIVIKVLAKSETVAGFTLTYIVPNAKWYPTYDIRVKDVSSPMQIEYKANVNQQSGEDWSNVKLRLSTGDPSKSSQKPLISTWYLYPNRSYVSPQRNDNYYRFTEEKFNKVKGMVLDKNTGEPLPFCNVMAYGTSIGTATDVDGNFSLVLPENTTHLEVKYIGYTTQRITIGQQDMKIYLEPMEMLMQEVVISDEVVTGEAEEIEARELQKIPGVKSNGWNAGTADGDVLYYMPTVTKVPNVVNTEFLIDEKYTVLSDKKNMVVSIKAIETNAAYQYYCAPRLDKDVFLTAMLTNWEQYDLLEGQANVFFEGTFVGNTLLDTRFLTDTLEISLGRDKSVKVERKKSKEYNKRQTIGSNNIAYRDWNIAVRNGKSQAVNIMIEDQFPVSADSKIDVKREEYSGGKLDGKTGIVTWDINSFTPGETKNFQLKYNVKYPKGSFIGLD